MPSERFMKLDEEKRQRIIKAAREEFSKVPFEEASINQIVKAAGISRGSFYTYFEDKRDILAYVLEDLEEKNEILNRELLLKFHGDFWKAEKEWIRYIVSIREATAVKESLNMFLETGNLIQLNALCSREQREEKINKELDWLLDHISPDCIDLTKSREALRVLFQCVRHIAGIFLLQILADHEHADNLMQEFDTYLDFVKYGAAPGIRAAALQKMHVEYRDGEEL